MRIQRYVPVAALGLIGLVATATAVADATPARHGAAGAAQPSEALAIWPETDKSAVPSTLPPWRESPKRTVTHFAHRVLGYSRPVVTVKRGGFHFQPGDRGYIVARTAGSHGIEVRVNRVIDATHWSVDDVWGFGKHEHGATVDITKRHADVGFGYWGRASSASLTLRYGEHQVRRTASDEATWSFAVDFPIDVSGAVLVLFRDSVGQVYTGWGTPLPSGRFSAG